MEIEQLGAWGDFIGGLAVVAGLIFVGVQLLGGNRETRASTIQTSLQMQILVDTELARYSDTWEKIISGVAIDDLAELRRAIILFNLVMTNLENRFHQFQAGYLDKKSWNASLEALHRFLASNIYSKWRESAGAATHSVDFLDLIDDVLSKSA